MSKQQRPDDSQRKGLLNQPARYPNAYNWFVLLATLDVILTALILHPLLFPRDETMAESRGVETNAIANWVFQNWGIPGMVVFKFTLVVVVIVVCQIIGGRDFEKGRRLAEWAVAITTIPVIVALVQMFADLYDWFHPAH